MTISKWSNDMSIAPRDGTPIWLYAKEWVDPDACPTGITEGFWSEIGDTQGWISVMWNMQNDEYSTVYGSNPTHWALISGPSEE